MSYTNEIFKRLDLQSIREFLLHGAEGLEISNQSYEQRIRNAEKISFQQLEKRFSKEEYDEIIADIYDFAGIVENVYTEIGMICGAVLIKNLLNIPPAE